MRLVRLTQASLTVLFALASANPGTSFGAPRKIKTKVPSQVPVAGDGGFDLDKLPKGKDVTIPRPATTFVPILDRVTLTATDLPQTVSFRPVNRHTGRLAAVKLSIYDGGSDRVQYVQVNPGTPFLYNFKELNSITVVTEASGTEQDGLRLQVESDKPLSIAH